MRRDSGVRNVYLAAIGCVAFMILLGYALLLFNPPTELDRACLDKPLASIGQCMADFHTRR